MSVVVPFAGDGRRAERLLAGLAPLELAPGDEIVVADNSGGFAGPALAAARERGVRVVPAPAERSSYHARNAGAAAARGEWLAFVDADCVPRPDLLERLFDPPPDDGVGALAGGVEVDPAQRAFLARYAADRGFLDQQDGVHTGGDGAATANLAVSRAAFEAVGGFEEGIRSGGDVDFCRRLVAAGWGIERRPEASVVHLHRESLADLLGAIARYAAGARWLDERYPGSAPRWPLGAGLASCARDIAGEASRRRWERAAFRAIDALGLVAHVWGYSRPNTP